MIIIDNYIIALVLSTPLLAAIFITLTPASDIGSKRAMSKFFSSIVFLFTLRLIYLFISNKTQNQYILSTNLNQINISFITSINKENIFLFCAIAIALLADMFLYEFNNTKTNIHQSAPFLLTFILFISLAQKDIRVALPIISAASFIIFFIIGHSSKKHRGAAIFQTGIVIFTCDALALILLQLKSSTTGSSTVFNLMQIAILLPGLSRITLPIFAPFMKTLFLNLEASEGPFILAFLHVAGFFILFITRNEINIDPSILSLIISIFSSLGALYLSFNVIYEKKIGIIPYYFLTLYSSLSASIIFITKKNESWHISAVVFLLSIIIFMYISKKASLTEQYNLFRTQNSSVSASWFLSLCLLLGLPGFGIGVVTWPALRAIYQHTLKATDSWSQLWHAIIISWVIALSLFAYGLLIKTKTGVPVMTGNKVVLVKKTFFLSPFIVAIISLIVPIATNYVSQQLK
ncbi:MAG: hypothetical protein KC505_07555 [Myxococcales bacterium]|nr:hypothetical protein [Myxococcales bacterium]